MSLFKKIRETIKTEVNYLFYRELRFKRKVKRHLQRYYSPSAPEAQNDQKMIVSMFDGRLSHGGLADRLRSIVTVYAYCRQHKLDFRIRFVSPFRLEEYLQPAAYDWQINDDELSYNSTDSRAVYIDSARTNPERDKLFQQKIAHKFFSQPYRQIHVYTSIYYQEARFGELFHELFRPAPALAAVVESHIGKLGGDGAYVAFSTRFMELLGDFNESRTRPARGLPDHEQEELIAKCLEQIKTIGAQHPEAKSLLVTSDSARFLERAAQLERVCILPGRIGHMDVVGGGEQADVHAKTFLDFLVMSHAAELYLLVSKPMYSGNFALRAAQINNRPFHKVTF